MTKGKSQFMNKFIGVKLQLSSYKHFSQIASKMPYSVLSLINLNRKIKKKQTCRMPSTNPC